MILIHEKGFYFIELLKKKCHPCLILQLIQVKSQVLPIPIFKLHY